jgi:hypothetical protein
MTVITITRPAKCSDCIFMKEHYEGKRKYHKCQNPASSHYEQFRRLKDKVCDHWILN